MMFPCCPSTCLSMAEQQALRGALRVTSNRLLMMLLLQTQHKPILLFTLGHRVTAEARCAGQPDCHAVDHRCAQRTLTVLLHPVLVLKLHGALPPNCPREPPIVFDHRPRSSLTPTPSQLHLCPCMILVTKSALDKGSVPPAVYFHNPWYTTWGGFKTDDCTRQALEPLLNMYGADLVYNGALKPNVLNPTPNALKPCPTVAAPCTPVYAALLWLPACFGSSPKRGWLVTPFAARRSHPR